MTEGNLLRNYPATQRRYPRSKKHIWPDVLIQSTNENTITIQNKEIQGEYTLMDNQIKLLRDLLANNNIQLNSVRADESVPEAERSNKTIKDRCRATFNSTPFPTLPPSSLSSSWQQHSG